MLVPRVALDYFEAGYSAQDVVRLGVETNSGTQVQPRTARSWYSAWREGTATAWGKSLDSPLDGEEQVRTVLKCAKDRWISLRELSGALDRSEETVRQILDVMQEQGYNVEYKDQAAHFSSKKSLLPREIVDPVANSHHLKLAVFGDTHLGSIYEQPTARKSFLHYAIKQGYKKFIFLGDLTDGLRMRTGWETTTYLHDVDSLLEACHQMFRDVQGHEVYVLGGNHDSSVIKNCSVDIIYQACRSLPNIHFLGYDRYDLPLTDKASLRLWHPDGAAGINLTGRVSTALLRITQEELEKELGGEEERDSKIRGILVGHFHIYSVLSYGQRTGIACPGLQSQSDYLWRKPLIPVVGGVLLDLKISDSGDVREWGTRLINYRSIENDYLNYPVSLIGKIDPILPLVKVSDAPPDDVR